MSSGKPRGCGGRNSQVVPSPCSETVCGVCCRIDPNELRRVVAGAEKRGKKLNAQTKLQDGDWQRRFTI